MSLYTEDLQAVVVADGDPVGLRGGPLHVVDLPFGRVGQDGVLDGPGHLLDVPDQGLVVVRCGRGWGGRRETFTPVSQTEIFKFPSGAVTCCADVTRGMRRPGDAVDTSAMVVEPRHGRARHAHVQDDHLKRRREERLRLALKKIPLWCVQKGGEKHLHAIHGHGGQIVGVLLIPAEAEERVVLRVFVDDGAVLQVPQVEHSDRPVRAHRRKHVSSSSRAAEGDVIHLRTHTRC